MDGSWREVEMEMDGIFFGRGVGGGRWFGLRACLPTCLCGSKGSERGGRGDLARDWTDDE